MQKAIVLFMLILFPVFVSGQVYQVKNVEVAASDTSTEEGADWYIMGTEADTSDVYDLFSDWGFDFWGADTTISDSVVVLITVQTACEESTDQFSSWHTLMTRDLEDDSTAHFENVTDSLYTIEQKVRFIATGGAANKKLYPNLVRIKLKQRKLNR